MGSKGYQLPLEVLSTLTELDLSIGVLPEEFFRRR